MTTEQDEFTRAYVDAALWAETDQADEQGGEPLDANYGPENFSPETMQLMVEDCADFQKRYAKLLADSGIKDSRAGHCFWLSRRGHGSGFFDEETIDEPFRDELQEAAESYGDFELYIGDDKQIWGPPADWYREHHPLGGKTTREVPYPRERRVVRDFASLPELVSHAKSVDGATHVLVTGRDVRIYFPQGGKYAAADPWQERGYWHLPSPSARDAVDRLPPGAQAIEDYLTKSGRWAAEARGRQTVRDYIAIDYRGRTVLGPTNDYDKAKRAADQNGGFVRYAPGRATREAKRAPARGAKPTAVAVATELSRRVNGSAPTVIPGGFRWGEPNEAARFTTHSPEYNQKVVVVISTFPKDGTIAQDFFSDEGLSGTARFENIAHFLYRDADYAEMAADLKWVWETVDGYAESWQEPEQEVDEARRRAHPMSRRFPRR